MSKESLLFDRVFKELIFTSTRSSGPGGQNVNKVETKMVLRFNIGNSSALSEDEKKRLLTYLESRLTKDGELIITAEEKRTQLQNKELAIRKLKQIIIQAFKKRKKRIATKPSKTAIQKRLTSKQKHSEKKQLRKKLS